jgi:hypothetical protein
MTMEEHRKGCRRLISSAYKGENKNLLGDHADQIRALAAEHDIGLTDSLHACMQSRSAATYPTFYRGATIPTGRGTRSLPEICCVGFPPDRRCATPPLLATVHSRTRTASWQWENENGIEKYRI